MFLRHIDVDTYQFYENVNRNINKMSILMDISKKKIINSRNKYLN